MGQKKTRENYRVKEKRLREDLNRLKKIVPSETRTDDGWGTIKPDKMEMEEAQLVVCSFCGCSNGRHLDICTG